MSNPVLPFVETMITQVCNLSCHGCTNYSDLDHRDYVPWSTGREHISLWKDRVEILDFGIMGGEPFINPQWQKWLYGTRELLPATQIRFTTNGLLLEKNLTNLLETLFDVGNIVFKITVHTSDNKIEEIISYLRHRYTWDPVVEFGVPRWKTKNNVRLQINRPNTFVKTYQGTYENMLPWNSNPTEAFKNCIQQQCPLLYQGKIYKCSTAGLLLDVLNRFNYPNNDEWQQYIDAGIDVNCTDDQLNDLIDNFGKPNKICGQCPTKNNQESIILHDLTVSKK